jgi:hypothetical protein
MTMPQAIAIGCIWIGVGLVGLSGLGAAGEAGPVCAMMLGFFALIATAAIVSFG